MRQSILSATSVCLIALSTSPICLGAPPAAPKPRIPGIHVGTVVAEIRTVATAAYRGGPPARLPAAAFAPALRGCYFGTTFGSPPGVPGGGTTGIGSVPGLPAGATGLVMAGSTFAGGLITESPAASPCPGAGVSSCGCCCTGSHPASGGLGRS